MSIKDEMWAELRRQYEARAFAAEVERDIALLEVTDDESSTVAD